MPKITGLFDSFDNLDQIPIESVALWLRPVPQLKQLENYLANRILYPQALPQTEVDMKIDLAILREALRIISGNSFLNVTLRKLLIPSELLNFVPDLVSLTQAFVDGLLLGRKKKNWFEDLWTVVLTGDIDEPVGSIIVPQFGNAGFMSLKVLGKSYGIKQGGLIVIPCLQKRCEIAYKFQNGSVLGKSESAVEVCGGKLGVMIDGRSI